MKFQLVINISRSNNSTDMQTLLKHTLEMIQMADEGGFEIVWAAEHHALELTIAPNPFQLLTWYAANTNQIRLGTAVVIAPYWHPIRLAGEAAMLDQISGGRLEFGIGSGAYQREFDRILPGVSQSEGHEYMHELLPAVQKLWQGDYKHNGKFWSFPTSTSVPKPFQQPHPPLWIAARAPVTYDFAVQHGCNIISWALTKPFSEVADYKTRFEDALAKFPDAQRPLFCTMRHTCVYDNIKQADVPVDATIRQAKRFENLFKNIGTVTNGFPETIDLEDLKQNNEFDRDSLHENLIFGTPPQVIEKLKRYEALGVDQFTYNSTFDLDVVFQKRSLELFIKEVMPAF